MIDPIHLLNGVIRPVLQDLGLGGRNAEAQVLGTACQESHCGLWLTQLAGGPARGIFQMEPATHNDIWDRFLSHNTDLSKKVNRWRTQYGNGMGSDEMVGNLYYAAAMCRIHYFRAPEALPESLSGQAALWKLRYNTPLGKGTVEQYIEAWKEFNHGGLLV